MRKLSKSRTEDDVISSTNGSVANDEQTDVDQSSQENEKEPDSETKNNEDDSEELTDIPKETKKSKAGKTKGKKRKSGKEDVKDDGDEENEVSTKGKKRKSGKEAKDDVEEEYEVDKIIDSKKIKGKLHYLIRWKGYSSDNDTWEPENTVSCPDLITKYHDEKENSKSKDDTPAKKGKKRASTLKKQSKSTPKKTKTEWDSKNADENAEYEVDRILEVHHKKNGKREFLIHWKGWSSKFDSWEPENHLNCPELIKKFMDKVDVARSTESKNLRVAPQTTDRFTLQDPSSGRRLSKRQGQRQRVRYDDAE